MHNCIICKNISCQSVFDLGLIYPSTFLKTNDIVPQPTSLNLVQCPKCELVQLSELFDLDNFYRQYWYQSGLNSSMVNSLKDIVNQIENRITLNDNDVVIDIGCNDGTLFTLYSNKNLFKVGFDPALNLKHIAENRCNHFVNDYFNGYKDKKAKVITAIAMFYDVLDPHSFLNKITDCLDENGIFVVQMTDLLSMVQINAFDNICHEHMCYYSLDVLTKLFAEHNLKIFDLEYNEVNGGSLRVYSAFERPISPNVSLALEKEKNCKGWQEWKEEIDNIKNKIVNYIKETVTQGKKVYVLGASTKGNTLLQYFGLNNTQIPYAADVNADKFGLRTVATNIEIISESEAFSHNPDIFLVLPWHFRKQLLSKTTQYLENGGKLLFPLPYPQIVSKEGVCDL